MEHLNPPAAASLLLLILINFCCWTGCMPHCRDLSISMDSLSSGRGEGRSIDWSHPMSNSAHLPPKSPGYSMFGGSSLFEGGNIFNVHSSFPSRGSNHKRTPSAGYLPQLQRPWLEEILESPDGDIVATVKKGSHRRSSSDSAAFQESPYDFKSTVASQSTAEEEYACGAHGAHTLRNVIPDYNRWAVSADIHYLQGIIDLGCKKILKQVWHCSKKELPTLCRCNLHCAGYVRRLWVSPSLRGLAI